MLIFIFMNYILFKKEISKSSHKFRIDILRHFFDEWNIDFRLLIRIIKRNKNLIVMWSVFLKIFLRIQNVVISYFNETWIKRDISKHLYFLFELIHIDK